MARELEDVLDLPGRGAFTGGANLVEDALGGDGVPGDDRVDNDREAQRLLALLIGGWGAQPDVALVGVEDGAPERAQPLARLELAANPRSELPVSQSREDAIRLDQASVLLQRPDERVAAATGLAPGKQQRDRHPAAAQ